jgi:MFS family permease
MSPDARRILAVQALRAVAYGLGSVVIGVSLARSGLSSTDVGLVFGAMLAGSALVLVLLARFGDQAGRRRVYCLLLFVMGVAGVAFALTSRLPLLILAALTGTVSADVVESGPFTSLEQAMLPQAAGTQGATRLFGTYNIVATLAGSLGALAAAGPMLTHSAPQRWLLVYPLVAALALPIAARLSNAIEAPVAPAVRGGRGRAPLGKSRGIVLKLSAFFALDSLGGGFVIQAFVAYIFVHRFGASARTIGLVFFAVGILQAVSFRVAVRLAERFGLLRTMVFTHLPSNVLLAAVAFAPNLAWAVALLLARFALSQMDVPTRQAYVVAVVTPAERTAAAAYTNTARYVVRPFAPMIAGAMLSGALSASFVVAGVLKSVYDVGLYVMFRKVEVDGE